MNYIRKCSDSLLGTALGLTFIINILNSARYEPDGVFLGEALGTLIMALALIAFFSFNTMKKIGLSFFTWLGLLFLIFAQCFRHDVNYPDGLIFPLSTLFVALLTSVAVNNVRNSQLFMHRLYFFIVITGVATVCIQLLQLTQMSPPFLGDFILKVANDYTPYGNIGQRNQVAFILVLGVVILLHRNDDNLRGGLIKRAILILMLSVGIGMTVSRGGVLLLGFAFVFWSVFGVRVTGVKHYTLIMIFAPIAVAGYALGAVLLEYYSSYNLSIITRSTSGGLQYRVSLLHQAWLAFQDGILFGVGWNNFNASGFEYAETLNWFYLVDHAHSLIPQIAAELGVLGLFVIIPAIIAVMMAIRFRYSSLESSVMNLIALFVLYSFSEFPLWYNFYLFPFVALVSAIEKTKVSRLSQFAIKKGSFVILSLIAVGAVFYSFVFISYAKSTAIITSKQINEEYKVRAYREQSNIFGFSKYNEFLLFQLIDVSNKDIKNKLQLGYRVVWQHSSVNGISKLAALEAFNGKPDKALKLFKSACLFNMMRECSKTTSLIRALNNEKPIIFSKILENYENWLLINNNARNFKQ